MYVECSEVEASPGGMAGVTLAKSGPSTVRARGAIRPESVLPPGSLALLGPSDASRSGRLHPCHEYQLDEFVI